MEPDRLDDVPDPSQVNSMDDDFYEALLAT